MQIRNRVRNGFLLGELLVALTLLAIVAAAITATMWRQSRGAQAATELSELRDQLNEGAGILAASLRGISPAGGDIYPGAMGKSSIEVRSPFGSSLICGISGSSILLPPNISLSTGNRFTFLYRRVEPGHGLLILDEGATSAASDDTWLLRNVTAVASQTNSCSGSPFTSLADAALSGFHVTLDAALPPTVSVGSPVVAVERVRYALYRASDNKWYLGSCASNSLALGCSTLQPLSGPFSAANADQESGLSGLDLYYFDADGLQTGSPFSVARIEIALRGSTHSVVPLSGFMSAQSTAAPGRDSVRIALEMRNR